MAETQGFEPWRDLHLLLVFETNPFNRLGMSPLSKILARINYNFNNNRKINFIVI